MACRDTRKLNPELQQAVVTRDEELTCSMAYLGHIGTVLLQVPCWLGELAFTAASMAAGRALNVITGG